ncbi:MAG TPA: class I SAM-dependent methyltransferase [Ignavibacteriaceae bacterium]|nr:class I SAM-dependent methyltransferase [Ignavibacteriaceae bacterium]
MNNDIPDPKKRFSSRVDNYVKYRPSYPSGIINFMQKELAIDKTKSISDIGSGTGIFTELLLKNNYVVYAVEPNDEMRHAAEKMLGSYPNFKSINGSAEKTGLDAGSIDLITAAQAFHWFQIDKAKKEFKRILRSNGWTILIWNTRANDASPFMKTYEDFLLKESVDYAKVSHTNIDEKELKNFFTFDYNKKEIPSKQVFDFEGLKGRVLSSSYMPDEKAAGFVKMMNSLTDLFDTHNENGFVEFIYKTEMHFGRL